MLNLFQHPPAGWGARGGPWNKFRVTDKSDPPISPIMASPEIETLTQALAKLPGLGPRSARRAVLHLLKKREAALGPLLRALEAV